MTLSVLRKLDSPVWQIGWSDFSTSASCLIFFYLGFLMTFSHFSCFKIHWIFKFKSFLGFALKLPKPDVPECQNG
jgi:hypothetical protein